MTNKGEKHRQSWLGLRLGHVWMGLRQKNRKQTHQTSTQAHNVERKEMRQNTGNDVALESESGVTVGGHGGHALARMDAGGHNWWSGHGKEAKKCIQGHLWIWDTNPYANMTQK